MLEVLCRGWLSGRHESASRRRRWRFYVANRHLSVVNPPEVKTEELPVQWIDREKGSERLGRSEKDDGGGAAKQRSDDGGDAAKLLGMGMSNMSKSVGRIVL